MATTEQIKALRDRTGISVMKCKKALEEAGGDIEKAVEILKREGAAFASKKSERALGGGVVASYVHSDSKMGVLAELLCETDFVARNDEFRTLADDIAMHIAAMNPASKEEALEQPFVKDPATTVKGMIEQATQKLGEKIELGRLSRLELFEEE